MNNKEVYPLWLTWLVYIIYSSDRNIGVWHDSITLQILPDRNIEVQYINYTSEYIPKLLIHQQTSTLDASKLGSIKSMGQIMLWPLVILIWIYMWNNYSLTPSVFNSCHLSFVTCVPKHRIIILLWVTFHLFLFDISNP